MPYAPPCSDDKHTSVVGPCSSFREDVRVEKEHKAKAGVLDTGLDSDGPSVFVWKFKHCTGTESDTECKKVMQK